MKKKKIFTLTMVAALFMSGCSLNSAALTDERTVSIERLHSKVKGIYFHDVHAYRDGNELVISGNVKRRYTSIPGNTGHVDVAIVAPDGKVVESVSAAYSPKAISKRSHPGSHFEVRLPIDLQKGSTVKVAIHENAVSDKTKEKRFDCGKNVAI